LGYIDKSLNLVIQPKYEEAEKFSEGLAAVKIGGKWGFIDTTGKMVIQPKYIYPYFSHPNSFRECLVSVAVDGELGFIDKTGKLVINLSKITEKFDKAQQEKIAKEEARLERLAQKEAEEANYPARPDKVKGVTSCNTNSFNADCYRTYDNGRKVHFMGTQKYNMFNSQFEWSCGDC